MGLHTLCYGASIVLVLASIGYTEVLRPAIINWLAKEASERKEIS